MDLGTTFVAAARSARSQVEMVTLGDRSVVVPSVVYVGVDGSVVTGEAAERRAVTSPERVARQFKRRLGDPTPMRLGDAGYPATELLAMVLRDVLARVSQTEGEPPEQVVLTHPANWGPFRRGVFEEVPRLAGVPEALTLTEPEAAAAHYAASRQLDTGEMVAVYDLGGGTFDATVVRKLANGVETLGTPEGVERLGGIDFDQALFDFVSYASNGALDGLDMWDPKTVIALTRLRQDCVLAKESLSVDTETVLPVLLRDRQFDVRITRKGFEDLIRAQIESTVTALSGALRSAGVTAEELSAVLLVGGSSRIPLVAQMVSEELGRPILLDTHPKYAVALGAATLTTQPVPPPATKPATKMATELVTGASGARRPRSIRSTLLVIAAALLLGGLATLGWTLSTLRGTLQANSSVAAAPVLPAVLPPPRHVPIPIETAQTTHLTKAGPFLLALNGARISELEADTLAPRWTLDLPKPGRFLHTLSDELVCVKTSPTECIPVNWVARTVGPALQLPGEVYVLLSFGSGKSVVMLDQTGTLSVMDIQTRSVRSVPVPGWSRTSGRTLLGVGEHRMYVVANDEAPAPVLMIVDLDIVAVVASMPWPRANTMTSPKATEYMQVSPDGGSLYTVGGQDLLIYETATMTLQRKAPQQTALKATMALSPDGRYLFLLTVDGELRVIEAATGLQVSSGRTTADARSVIDLDRGRKVAVYNNTTPRGYDLFDTSAFAAS